MGIADAETIHPESVSDWHAWLAAHHAQGRGVWVAVRKPTSDPSLLSYDALIREALCWGWIDGQSRPLDASHSRLWMTRRKPSSPWSASNKARVADLEREGRLQPAGRAAIDLARRTGTWEILDAAEALIEPDDLAVALDEATGARTTWEAYPMGVRKMVLSQLALAKRPETRAQRIERYVTRAAQGQRPI